jgi:uncharacterized membrane protein (DUF4010 family)
MLQDLLRVVPAHVVDIGLVLALAFFIGLEREEHKQREASYAFGGVRTFPLIGLVSYSLALLSGQALTAWMLGFAVVGGFMLLSYRHKLEGEVPAGLTTEISALATYVIGGLVEHQQYWIATTIAVLSVLLLELKKVLEGLTKQFASTEVIAVAKFLVLSVVILPVVPDRELTRFHLNPFKTWLVVVAVSGVSFVSYVLQRVWKQRGGVPLAAILGGAYSSTVTTVVLARQAKGQGQPSLFSGSILMASGMMYARLVLLLAIFNWSLARALAPSFGVLAVVGCVVGWLVSRRTDASAATPVDRSEPKNPLELRAAFLFALVFVVISVVTKLAEVYLGSVGLYVLAAIMGVTDVDPFILGLTQPGAGAVPLPTAGGAIVIAAASNNVIKAIYASYFADRETGRQSLVLLLAFAALGIIPLIWM